MRLFLSKFGNAVHYPRVLLVKWSLFCPKKFIETMLEISDWILMRKEKNMSNPFEFQSKKKYWDKRHFKISFNNGWQQNKT
jgi:hypothetical protein